MSKNVLLNPDAITSAGKYRLLVQNILKGDVAFMKDGNEWLLVWEMIAAYDQATELKPALMGVLYPLYQKMATHLTVPEDLQMRLCQIVTNQVYPLFPNEAASLRDAQIVPGLLDAAMYRAMTQSVIVDEGERFIEQSFLEIEVIESTRNYVDVPLAIAGNVKTWVSVEHHSIDSQVASPHQKQHSKRWINIRLKYEFTWRCVSLNERSSYHNRKAMTRLLHTILVLASHFQEYDYAWHQYELSGSLKKSLTILAQVGQMCQEAMAEDMIWLGRIWVVHKQILSLDLGDVTTSPNYVRFMKFFLMAIKDSGSDVICKFVRYMMKFTTHNFFPVIESITQIMLEEATKIPTKAYIDAIEAVFELHQQMRPDEDYFCPDNYCKYLYLLKVAGDRQGFLKLLQGLNAKKKEYSAKVKLLYTLLIKVESTVNNQLEQQLAEIAARIY